MIVSVSHLQQEFPQQTSEQLQLQALVERVQLFTVFSVPLIFVN